MTDEPWVDACSRWKAAVGDEHVTTDPDALARAARATFATSQRIPVIVRPADRAEVQECLTIASQCGVAVYPSSRGCNWGLGSKVPVADRCALLELTRLDRIVDFSESMATITIEPGVTFEQVVDYLKEQRSSLFFNITGSSPWSSPLANALERGDGVGPYGDRVAHVCGLEVVLADGSVVHTGMSRFEGASTATLYRGGVGPSLDGLFVQSNLGVVTKMTFWLKPRPAVLQIVRYRIDDPAGLGSVMDAMRQLRLEGTNTSGMGVWNDFRAFSARGGFPFATDQPPLTRARMHELQPDVGAWFGLTTQYSAHREQALGNVARLREVLSPVADTVSVSLQYAEDDRIEDIVLKGQPSTLAPFGDVSMAFRLMHGHPSVASQRSMYWRKKSATEGFQSPEDDGCGVLWACPLVPLAGDAVRRANEVVERIVLDHGFEPLFSWVIQHERVAYFIVLIIFDRDIPGQDEQAIACHDKVIEAAIANGWLPWRLGIQSMDDLPGGRDESDAILRRIKNALDPAGVLAPGRYLAQGD